MAKKQVAKTPKEQEKEQEEILEALDATEETPVTSSAESVDTSGESPRVTSRSKKVSNGKSVSKSNSSVIPPEPPTEGTSVNSSRRLPIIIGVVAAVLVAAAAVGYAKFGSTQSEEPSTDLPDTEQLSQMPRRIDGVLDDPEDQNRYPIAIMVENHPASRPQSGLDRANVVFEALAEGGITRFMPLYTLTDSIEEIGPVRSARPYYVDWATGFKAMYVHIGGSAKALSRITSSNTFDLNQFSNSQYFYRDSSKKVASEHTLYTSSKLMALALIDKKAPETGSYDAWKFKADAESSSRPASQHITIDYSTFSYKVDYEYDPATSTYARSQAEQPHLVRSGDQIKAKNVLILTVERRLEQPVDGKGRLEMDTVGEGSARFFIDGKEMKGTWKKGAPQDQLKFYLENGNELELNVGQTWVEIVPPDREVTIR